MEIESKLYKIEKYLLNKNQKEFKKNLENLNNEDIKEIVNICNIVQKILYSYKKNPRRT